MVITKEQQELALHRFQRAEEAFMEAKEELARNHLRLCVNRAYYAAFYAMRALLALVAKDSSKHSGVISLFNQEFIKTGFISEVSFKSIQLLMDLRHEADYQDFSEIKEDEAQEAVQSAQIIISSLDEALKKLLENAHL
jgi:uncharacterized protein (UPF0332 family)